MTLLAQLSFCLLAALTLAQGIYVVGFVWQLLRFQRPLVCDSDAVPATVVLCLRGGDPFLRDCLHGLLMQDYPTFTVLVVVDHPDDPAMHALQEFRGDPRLEIQLLDYPRDTCSLKCSSLVQAVRSLDPTVEIVAQIDADTIPHPSWLRELATALQDERIGAATGNRWYMPANPGQASLVRYLWNAAAIVQMYWYRIAWGGTLAIKTSVFRNSDLLDYWSHAFCEDTMLYTRLKALNLEVAFVPSLTMVNREDCDLRGYFQWVCRQLLTARLYHPAWLAVAAHGVLSILTPYCVLALAAIAASWGNLAAARLAGVSFIAYQVIFLLMLVPLELSVRRIVAARHQTTQWLGWSGVCQLVLAVPLTQFVYALALATASRMRFVAWRGVRYRIAKSGAIKLEEYKRFAAPPDHQRTLL
ncbi:MAG: glycosyltransferase family 2 protein [Pirellulaceae bacterium]